MSSESRKGIPIRVLALYLPFCFCHAVRVFGQITHEISLCCKACLCHLHLMPGTAAVKHVPLPGSSSVHLTPQNDVMYLSRTALWFLVLGVLISTWSLLPWLHCFISRLWHVLRERAGREVPPWDTPRHGIEMVQTYGLTMYEMGISLL